MQDNQTGGAGIVLYRIDELSRHVDRQDVKIAALEAMIIDERTARSREDRNRLIAGIMLLGSLVTGLFGILWAYRAVIFREQQ